MITFAVIVIATIVVAGSSVMLYALNHAVDGYEDEHGFHQGMAPLEAGIIGADLRVVPTTDRSEAWSSRDPEALGRRHTSARTAGVW